MPYMIYDTCEHDANYTPSVRFTGQKAMVLRSHMTHVHGDEPGVGKGVKSGTVGGISEPIGHAAQVRAEGSPVIRHLDRFHMNNRNTVGEAIFLRDTATYPAPEDDDPVPGSLQLASASSEAEGASPMIGFVAPGGMPAPPGGPACNGCTSSRAASGHSPRPASPDHAATRWQSGTLSRGAGRPGHCPAGPKPTGGRHAARGARWDTARRPGAAAAGGAPPPACPCPGYCPCHRARGLSQEMRGWLKRHGMRSSIPLCGWPSRMARRVVAR